MRSDPQCNFFSDQFEKERGLKDSYPIQKRPSKNHEDARIRAFRSLSVFLCANDDTIEDLLNMIDNWEAITGKPFLTDSHVAEQPGAKLSLLQKAERLIHQRDWQYRMMPVELRQESYLRILVVLMIESLSGKKVASKSICIASGCPGTTALRYLDKLAAMGLVRRENCPTDGRVTHIVLTPEGYDLARTLVTYDEDQTASR